MEQIVEQALYAALAADAGITGVTGAIYPDRAPSGANATTYVIFSLAAGTTTNDANDDNTDLRYLVKCVSTDFGKANSVASAIRTLLHEGSLTLSGGWTCYRMQVITPVRFVETIDRVAYWHKGHIIRIRSQKALT
jgi:hypothetical protein